MKKLFIKRKGHEEHKGYKIVLVEDGSIDVDGLEQFINEHELKITIVVYRAGSVPHCFLNEQKNELCRR